MIRRRKTHVFRFIGVPLDEINIDGLTARWLIINEGLKYGEPSIDVQYNLFDGWTADVTFTAYRIVRRRT